MLGQTKFSCRTGSLSLDGFAGGLGRLDACCPVAKVHTGSRVGEPWQQVAPTDSYGYAVIMPLRHHLYLLIDTYD